MTNQITEKIREGISPVHLEVINESHMHNVPKGSESHFKLIVVSDLFQGLLPLARHRKIYDALSHEVQGEMIHALSIHTYTPGEWEKINRKTIQSPPCLGGKNS